MSIPEAQKEMRARYCGGFYGQLVSGILWLVSACLGTWGSPRAAITSLVVSGFFIFAITELLIRIAGGAPAVSADNALRGLGMQTAFVLPISMLLLLPVTLFRLNLFYPALMILLGAHYFPFVTLYGMRMFAVLATVLIGGGVIIAQYGSDRFSDGAWYTGAMLLLFAVIGRATARKESLGMEPRAR
jgi:Family of unknown function (DUF7010)